MCAEAPNGATGDLDSILDYGYFGVLAAEFGPGVLRLSHVPLRDTPLFLLDGTPWQ